MNYKKIPAPKPTQTLLQTHVHEHSKNNPLDIVGIMLSVLCAIHCISVPVVAILVPHISSLNDSHYFHEVIALLIVPLAVVTLWQSIKFHKTYWPLFSGILGLSLVVFSIIAFPNYISEKLEVALTVSGSLFLITTHYLNWRACRCSMKSH